LTTESIIVRDPKRGERTLWTVGQWMSEEGQGCGSGSCWINIMRGGRKYFATQELADFDYLGGVYSGPPPEGATGRWKAGGTGECYWDPNDSGPDQCSPEVPTGRWKDDGNGGCYWDPNDSGPDQCVPTLAPQEQLGLFSRVLRSLMPRRARTVRASMASSLPARLTRGGAVHVSTSSQVQPSAPKRPLRAHSPVPRPWGSSKKDVSANFYAAVRQTQLDRVHGLEKLSAANSDWYVRDVISVRSIGPGSDYYLLQISDGTGKLVGSAALNDEGYMMGYEDAGSMSLPGPIALDDAEANVRLRKGQGVARGRAYVYGPTNIPGVSRFSPLVQVERQDGTYFINPDGSVFREETRETNTSLSNVVERPQMLLRDRGVREFGRLY
jgi:hypothetical protein